MKSEQIQHALSDITAETDPTLKHLKLASLVSAVFRERGIELVVVGGSAIEFYTEGAYVSKYPGDYPPARECAKKLLAAALLNEIETGWAEVKRLAKSKAYKNWNDVKELVHEQAQSLQVRSPYHPDE